MKRVLLIGLCLMFLLTGCGDHMLKDRYEYTDANGINYLEFSTDGTAVMGTMLTSGSNIFMRTGTYKYDKERDKYILDFGGLLTGEAQLNKDGDIYLDNDTSTIYKKVK